MLYLLSDLTKVTNIETSNLNFAAILHPAKLVSIVDTYLTEQAMTGKPTVMAESNATLITIAALMGKFSGLLLRKPLYEGIVTLQPGDEVITLSSAPVLEYPAFLTLVQVIPTP